MRFVGDVCVCRVTQFSTGRVEKKKARRHSRAQDNENIPERVRWRETKPNSKSTG